MRRRLAPLILLGALAAASSADAAETGARCWYENGAVVIPAAFGDIAGDFVLDASAPSSSLHDTIAQAAGFESDSVTADLRIAGRSVPALTMAVENLDARAVGFPTTIVGVIGADLLKRFVVGIDFEPCRLTLLDHAPRRRHGSVRLGVTEVAGAPAVSAAATDGVRVRRGLFAIDTASVGVRFDPAETSFSRPLAPNVDPTLRHRPPARLAGLSLADRAYARTPAGLMEKTPSGLSGAIGDAVWSRYRLRLDLKAGWLELAPRR